MKRVFAVYFSATDTTKRCVEAICKGLCNNEVTQSINLADNLLADLPEPEEDDVIVVGSPVYGGRLPVSVADALRRLNGNHASAVAVVVFGNRDYDDALLELTDILKSSGCRIAGAGAFVARHSIFPRVASDRPDASDLHNLQAFGEAVAKAWKPVEEYSEIEIKGKRPCKKVAGVPLHPSADARKCNGCGTCAKHCPSGAIDPANPALTDNAVCLSCGRCIKVCPREARRYSGLMYKTVRALFQLAFSGPQSPLWHIG